MSIVAKQLQQPFHSPTRQLQQLRARTFPRSHQELKVKKSISPTEESHEKNLEEKELKTLRKLYKQTSVVAVEAEKKPEIKRNRTQSQDTRKVLVKEWEDTCWNEPENSVTKDFRIYQNGRANEFFQHKGSEKPKSVADICLVNDHYILVKMPDQDTTSANNNNLSQAAARRKEFRSLKEQTYKMTLKGNEKANKKLCRYLRSKRNRITKIAPIHEEPEDLSDDEGKTPSKSYCLKMQSCWQANDHEVESYQTQTKIRKNIPNCDCDDKTVKRSSSPKRVIALESQWPETQKPRHIPTISGNLIKSSLQYQVSLQNYGSLVESQGDDIKAPKTINSPPRRKCPHLERLYCFFRPFRGKCRKSKPKIQAVVYKTYFVKWTKPPDTLTHGYGVKTLSSSHAEMSVLRRCRSATF